MVGADRYLSMHEALEQVNTMPAVLFKNTELKDAEQHVSKLKALGVGFRIVQADGTEDDSVINDTDIPGGAHIKSVGPARHDEAHPHENVTPSSAFGPAPPPVSILDAISHHHHQDPHGGKKGSGDHGELTGFGSGGGSGSGSGGHGIRANSDMIGNLRKSEAAANRRNRAVSIIMAASVVLFALLFYISKSKTYNIKKITIQSAAGEKGIKHQSSDGGNGSDGGGGASDSRAASAGGSGSGVGDIDPERQFTGGRDNGKPRGSINNQQKQQASNYVDSAKTNSSDLDKQVKFYKIAISFNRYNLQAWHGLLQTYREMNKTAEARETEAHMKEIFGDDVNSVNAAITQFGDIVDAYRNESGTYRVEYKTKKTSKEEILRDVFNMTRAIRNSCNCKNISIYASTGPGNGLVVHTTAATPVHTLPEFSQQANIHWFE